MEVILANHFYALEMIDLGYERQGVERLKRGADILCKLHGAKLHLKSMLDYSNALLYSRIRSSRAAALVEGDIGRERHEE